MFFVLKITHICVVQTFEDVLLCFLVLETYTKRYLQNDVSIWICWCKSSSVSLLSFHCGYNFSLKFILLIMLTLEVEVTMLLQRSGNHLPSDTCHIQKDLKLCLHCCEKITYHSMSCVCAQHVSSWKCQNCMEKLMCAINMFWERIRKTWKKDKISLFLWHPGYLSMFWRNILLEGGGRIFFQNTRNHLLHQITYQVTAVMSSMCDSWHDMTWRIPTDATEPLLKFFGKKSLKLLYCLSCYVWK